MPQGYLEHRPINKVGLILLRDVQAADPQIFLTRVKAKNPDEQGSIDFGLPKGTRRYYDEQTKNLIDARDAQTALAHRHTLEPLADALRAEAWEEAGIPTHAPLPVRELGLRPFTSRQSRAGVPSSYDISWYVVEATPSLIQQMDPNPADAHEVGWFNLSTIRQMEADGAINPSYAQVVEEAIEKMRSNALKLASFSASPTR